ncbi:MAG TPA: hypothetical protein VG900_02230 [Hyphomicrobiaceae bacterium]|nr:hypothetical protein [Hyphomicrobiaceae bacterium]
MNKVIALIPILAWAGVVSTAGSSRLDADARKTRAAYAEAVTVAQPRLPEPVIVKVPQRAHPAPPINPADSAGLARALQSELKRVGCYEGHVSSVWTPAARKAMQTFTERTNARLPVDKPDVVLLSLVQSHREPVCVAEAATLGEVPKVAEKSAVASPALVPAAAAVPAVALPAMHSRDKGAPAPVPKREMARDKAVPVTPSRQAAVSPQANSDDSGSLEPKAPSSAARRTSGPVPPAGIRGHRSRRPAKHDADQPPKFIRSFIRSVKRTLAPLGLD